MAAAAVETLPGLDRHVDGLVVPSGIGANQGVIKNEHIQRLRPTPKDTPISEIRKRLKEDGYIFMKGLIPREDVLNVRKQYAFPLLIHFLTFHTKSILIHHTATSRTGPTPRSSNPEPRRRKASSTPPRTRSTTAALAPATCLSARRRLRG